MKTLREVQADLESGRLAVLADGTSPLVTWVQNMSDASGGQLYGGMIDGQSVVSLGLDAIIAEVAKLKPDLATHSLWTTMSLQEAAAKSVISKA